MEYKIRKIRARKSDSEIELEFETAVTLKEAEEVAHSALSKLLAISSPTLPSVTQTLPAVEGREEYPSISKPESCSDAITKLLSTEWGKKPRTMAELKEAMTSNAVYYPEGTFKSTFTKMTKNGKLRRVKKGDVFAYILQ
jgi:hypothetical protein